MTDSKRISSVAAGAAGERLMREAREQQRDLEEMMPIILRNARSADASPSE